MPPHLLVAIVGSGVYMVTGVPGTETDVRTAYASGPRLRMLLATRRSDSSAYAAWGGLLTTLQRSPQLEGLVIDRTTDGSAGQYARDHGDELIRQDRLDIVRQDYTAPVRDIVATWADAPLRWTLAVHDDDHWEGVPSLPSCPATDVSLYVPRLFGRLAADEPWALMHRWTGQHALFGAAAPYVQKPFLAYVRDEPVSFGGEDLLLLFLCMGLGSIREMPDYTYFWDGANWGSDDAAQASTREYTHGLLDDEIGSSSAFILFQSLDRLAICSYLIDQVPDRVVLGMSRLALGTFWPVVDRRAHAVYSRASARFRINLLATRGSGRSIGRLVSVVAGAFHHAPNLGGNCTYLQAVDAGVTKMSTMAEIRGLLLPDLRRALQHQSEALNQVDHWEAGIGRVAEFIQRPSNPSQGSWPK